ncbi:MAG: hypothetical protein IID55_13645 [Proteobacteria bacterium]|nr:hypothetical protein [Pseudomonadota bacterium]
MEVDNGTVGGLVFDEAERSELAALTARSELAALTAWRKTAQALAACSLRRREITGTFGP